MLDILHEDADILVVNKPAGLVCHPSKDGEASSLVGRVRMHLATAEGRLVNRLDRETSGVVLLAKSATAAGELGKLVAAGAMEKVYDAVVHGHLAVDADDKELCIRSPLGKDEGSAVAIKDCVRPDGAPAETRVKLVRHLEREGRRFSVVEVRPITGRKHQIRIHLAHAGHPIVGDKIYGGDEGIYLRFVTGAMTDADRAALIVEHHALHARRLAFTWRSRDRALVAQPATDSPISRLSDSPITPAASG